MSVSSIPVNKKKTTHKHHVYLKLSNVNTYVFVFVSNNW